MENGGLDAMHSQADPKKQGGSILQSILPIF
jgi:hypothetical protein